MARSQQFESAVYGIKPKRIAMRHRAEDGRFYNPWPGVKERGFRDLVRWWRERRLIELPPDPDPTAFSQATPTFGAPHAPDRALSATWVGHSTVLVQLGGLNVLTDPMWSTHASPLPGLGPRRWVPPGIRLDALPPIDLILLSHNHYDHLDERTVRALARQQPTAHWIVPLGLASFVRQRGVRHVSELDWWDEAIVGTARIACTPAQHFSARGLTDRRRTLWCGFVVRTVDQTLFFAGDTGYHPAFTAIGERYGPFDLLLLPIGAYEPRWFMHPMHMNPEEAVRAFSDLTASSTSDHSIVLGIHWGTFKLTDEPMDEPPKRMQAAWQATALPEEQLWILRHGETKWRSGLG